MTTIIAILALTSPQFGPDPQEQADLKRAIAMSHKAADAGWARLVMDYQAHSGKKGAWFLLGIQEKTDVAFYKLVSIGPDRVTVVNAGPKSNRKRELKEGAKATYARSRVVDFAYQTAPKTPIRGFFFGAELSKLIRQKLK